MGTFVRVDDTTGSASYAADKGPWASPFGDEHRRDSTMRPAWRRRVSPLSGRLSLPVAVQALCRRGRHQTPSEGQRILVEEAGGRCVLCGYARCIVCLHFHHVDPATKAFGINLGHGRALAAYREEARKCVLVCAKLPRRDRDRPRRLAASGRWIHPLTGSSLQAAVWVAPDQASAAPAARRRIENSYVRATPSQHPAD